MSVSRCKGGEEINRRGKDVRTVDTGCRRADTSYVSSQEILKSSSVARDLALNF